MVSDQQLRAIGLSRATTRLLGPLIRALLVVLALGVGLHQVLAYAKIAQTTVTVREMADFDVFYRSSQRVAQASGNPYDRFPLPGAASELRTPNLNPPHVVAALVPLTFFAPHTALLIWTMASVASAFIALWIIFRELGIRPTPTAVAWTVLALLCAAPTGALLHTAQISWLLWTPVTWAWAAARNGRWRPAAAALGLAMSIKPFLGLFVLLLAIKKRWAPMAIASLTAAAFFASGALTLGWSPFASWLRAVGSVTWVDHIFNMSSLGFIDRLFTNRVILQPAWNLAPLVRAPDLIWPLSIVAAGSALALWAWSVHWGEPGRTTGVRARSQFQTDRLFLLTLSTALLVTPAGWIYYLFLLAGPLLGVGSDARLWSAPHWRGIVFAASGTCVVLSPGTLASAQPSGLATATLGSAYFWGLLGLWTCALSPLEEPPGGAGRGL